MLHLSKLKALGIVTLVLETNNTKRFIKTHNLITTAGDIYYGQKVAGETPTNDFASGRLVLGTAGDAPAKNSQYSNITTVVAGSLKAFDGTYPKRNDDDVDNAGAGAAIISYRVSYSSGEANAVNIDRIAITLPSPTGGSPLLMYATLTPFTKTSSDTLKVYVNHQFLGV